MAVVVVVVVAVVVVDMVVTADQSNSIRIRVGGWPQMTSQDWLDDKRTSRLL